MQELWQNSHRSVVSLTFENAEGRIGSGTGFKVGPFLVTNNHVVQVPNVRRVVLRGVQQDGYTTAFEKSFGHLTFRDMLVTGDPEKAWDYAIYNVPTQAFAELPSLELAEGDAIEIGMEVALLGYQFDQLHQSVHRGYISSQYKKADVHYLQLDASVNHGNSGGPLIDTRTGRVIGIVTRKATGLSEQFESLVATFQNNIAVLKSSGAVASMGGIDLVQGAIATQAQLDRLAREIGRSANVGIGYAYHIKKVRASMEYLL